jgi:hypothetical protein
LSPPSLCLSSANEIERFLLQENNWCVNNFFFGVADDDDVAESMYEQEIPELQTIE